MSCAFTYIANRRHPIQAALYQERHCLKLPAKFQPQAWGLGFFQGGEVLHSKRPHDDERLDWLEMVGDLKTDCAIGQVSDDQLDEFHPENTPPFRFRRWLFSCVSPANTRKADAALAWRESIYGALPDFLRRSIRGGSDDEHLFHYLLMHLHQSGVIDVYEPSREMIAQALKSAAERLEQDDFAMFLTHGQTVYALHRGRKVYVVERERVDSSPPTMESEGPGKLPDLKYSMLLTGFDIPAECPAKPVPEDQVITVDKKIQVSVVDGV